MQGRLRRFLLGMLLCYSGGLLASPAIVAIGPFQSFHSTQDPELAAKIYQALKANAESNGFVTVDISNSDQALAEAASLHASILVSGYYSTNRGATLFGQIYDVRTASLIDAFNMKDDAAVLRELLPANDPLLRQSEASTDLVDKFAAKVVSRLLTNPNRRERADNIREYVDGSELAREIKFPRAKAESPSSDIFRLLEEQQVVTGTRSDQTLKEVPTTIRVITEEDIRTHRYKYLEDLLRDQPGFDIIFFQGLYGTIFMQGGLDAPETLRTLVLIDGVPDNNISAGSAYIKHKYSLHNVKRVEILYGPASSLYGANAYSGVINMITKDGEDIKRYAEFGLGSYYYEPPFKRPGPNAFLTTGGVIGSDEDRLSIIASGHWINTQGPILNQQSGTDPTKAVYYWSDGYSGSSLNDNYMASLKMRYKSVTVGAWQARDYTGQGTYATSAAYLDDGTKTYWNTLTSTYYGKLDQPMGDHLKEHLQVAYRETGVTDGFDVDRSTIGNFAGKVTVTRYRRPDREISADNPFLIKWSNRLTTTVGASYVRQEAWTYNTRAQTFNSVPEFYALGSQIPPDLDPRNKFYNTNGAGYIEQYWRMAEMFSATFGYRYDHFSLQGKDGPEFCGTDEASLPNGVTNPHFVSPENAVNLGCVSNGRRQYYSHNPASRKYNSSNPRAGLVFSPSTRLTGKFSIGEAFRVPTVREMYSGSSSRLANSELQPEKIRTAEAGVIYYPVDGLRTEGMIFASYVKNLISLAATDVHSPGKSQTTYMSAFQNAGSAQVYGSQVSADGKLYDWLHVLWNYTYQQSWIFDASDSNLLAHGSSVYETLYPSQTTICKTVLVTQGLTYLNDYCPRAHGRMPRVATHKMNIGTTMLFGPHWQFDVRFNYVGARKNIATDPLNSVPAYLLANLSFGTRDYPFTGMDITIRVQNAFNDLVLDPGTRDARGDYFPAAHPQPERVIGWEITQKL